MKLNTYYDKKAISQSLLKAANKGVNGYKKYLKLGELNYNLSLADSIAIGNAVDCKLTTPEDFKHLYTIAPNLHFPDSVIKVLTYLIDLKLEYSDENILEVVKTKMFYEGFGASKPHKIPTILAKFNYAEAYYHFLINNKGKTVLDIERVITIDRCYSAFKNSYTAPFFDTNLTMKYQVAVFNNMYNNRNCKALLDMLLLNETTEPIKVGNLVIPPMSFTVIDIKTGNYLPENIISYMYKWDIQFQLTWYTDMYSLNTSLTPNLPIILYATTQPGIEYTSYYQLSNEDLEVGRHGGYKNARGTYSPYPVNEESDNYPTDKKGYIQSLKDYIAFEYNQFTIPNKILRNEGCIPNCD